MTARSAWSSTLAALTLASAVLGAACGGIIDGNGETGYRNIGAAGGEVRAKSTVVTVPEGAVSSPTVFTISPVPEDQLPGLPEGLAGRAWDISPAGVAFLGLVGVQTSFDPAALPDPTRPDLTWVGIEVDGEWEPLLDPTVDEVANTVGGTTPRSGRFGVVHGCGRGRRCPVALEFTSAPQAVRAGECSGAVALHTIDAAGRPSPVQRDTAVALSADEASLRFYADASCQVPVSALSIPARQTDATFYFSGRAARSVTLTAQARDLRPGTQDETILAGPGVTLTFVTGPQQLVSGACSSAATVAFEDLYGNRAPVPNDARVLLSATSTAGGTVTFFSDDACATATSGVTMTGGTAAVSFWFKDSFGPTPGGDTATLTATAGAFGGSFTASQAESVQTPVPAGLKFYSLPQTVNAGFCSGPVMIGLVDASGNRAPATARTIVALQTPAGFMAFADAACAAPTNTVTISAGSMSTNFYFLAPNTGTYTLTAASTGLTSASQDETVR